MGGSRHTWRRATRLLAAAGVIAMAVAGDAGSASSAPGVGPQPLNVALAGPTGHGRIVPHGRTCAQQGDGSSWHYEYEAPLAPGPMSNLAGDARVHLDLHTQNPGVGAKLPNNSPPVGAPPSSAYLQGEESGVALSNERGHVRLALRSGSCTSPSLAFDGTTASGLGTWRIVATAGAYRQATGNGRFDVRAAVAPGADNAFALDLQGTIRVLQPDVLVETVTSYWGYLGTDYLLRRVTVVYRITNNGEGDAFDVRLTNASSPTPGVTKLGPVPQRLGDLHAGESEIIRVKWQLGLLAPCALVILDCEFDTTLTFDMPDALDDVAVESGTSHVKAPNLPPPL